jgi:hypothetical protein
MKIGYLDAQIQIEDYSLNPKGYGGAACFARYAKIMLNNQKDQFFIFGSAENFKNVPNDENILNCIIIPDEHWSAMRNGAPIKDFIPEAETFDIIIFHHDCMTFNVSGLKAKLVHWSLMSCPRSGHPHTPYHLMYTPGTTCHYGKSYPIVIGKYVADEFAPSPREDLIFNCGRNDIYFNSIKTAQFCLENGIKGVFAGPILDNYPLLDYIDNKTTFYLGLISEEEKLNWLRKATASTYLHTWDTAFNLSAVESLSVGTPIITAKRGCFEYLTQEGINGYYWNGSNLKEVYDKSKFLDQVKVWESAKRFSHKAMVDSFYKAFEQILAE